MAIRTHNLTSLDLVHEGLETQRRVEPGHLTALITDVVEIHRFRWKGPAAVGTWLGLQPPQEVLMACNAPGTTPCQQFQVMRSVVWILIPLSPGCFRAIPAV